MNKLKHFKSKRRAPQFLLQVLVAAMSAAGNLVDAATIGHLPQLQITASLTDQVDNNLAQMNHKIEAVQEGMSLAQA